MLALIPVSGEAAEQVHFDLWLLSRSVSTESLANFAATGTVDEELLPYLRRLTPEQQATLRTALTASRPVNLVHLTNWFYSSMGEDTLLFAGDLMQTDGGLNGQKALRASLIATAAEAGELSLLEVIQQFPTPSLRLDLNRILLVVRQLEAERGTTLAFQTAIAQQSQADAAQSPIDLSTLPDLNQPGPYATRRLSLILEDPSRDRTYPVELFLPENLAAVPGRLPVMVVSHGLGDSRTSFLDAEHIATYGFAVVLPEHIGSNVTQKAALLDGLDNELFKTREFLDRPLDITFLLDELERTNASQYSGKLDLERVGVIGHSFGGYTALALAGATIDFDSLARQCTPDVNILLNAAQLLECQALELKQDPEVWQQLEVQGVRDERVKFIMAFAPVSYLFSQQGISQIQIPTVILGGAYDIVAAVVPEQIEAFSWLTTDDKYLYFYENTSHTAGLTRLVDSVFHISKDFDEGVEQGAVLTRENSKALATAFAKVYLSDDQTYAPFLTAAYIETVSQEPFKKHLIREVPDHWLESFD